MRIALLLAVALAGTCTVASAQTPPSPAELAAYRGLHAAAGAGDVTLVESLLRSGADPNARDVQGRTPLHVAAFNARAHAMRALVSGGADPRAQQNARYDIITIAAVRDDLPTLRAALEIGADPRAVTSPYDGTALIAAAHLGHDRVVRELIRAGAPLDHVNNLGWTALIEAVILGDGGPRHTATVRALVEAGANPNIADRGGTTPLAHARARGYREIAAILDARGGR